MRAGHTTVSPGQVIARRAAVAPQASSRAARQPDHRMIHPEPRHQSAHRTTSASGRAFWIAITWSGDFLKTSVGTPTKRSDLSVARPQGCWSVQLGSVPPGSPDRAKAPGPSRRRTRPSPGYADPMRLDDRIRLRPGYLRRQAIHCNCRRPAKPCKASTFSLSIEDHRLQRRQPCGGRFTSVRFPQAMSETSSTPAGAASKAEDPSCLIRIPRSISAEPRPAGNGPAFSTSQLIIVS